MKLMKDMNRDELIELVAAVSLRVLAFDYALAAFSHIYHLSRFLSNGTTPATNSYTANGYYMDIAFDTVISTVMFLLTIPLARLLCRGLSLGLEPKPVV